MNKIKFTLKHIAVLAVLISTFIACDKDFATVGSDIIGQNNFGVRDTLYPVIAYTNPLEAVQTNNLPVNYLGVYKDPFYGLMTASVVSQMSISTLNAEFGEGVALDSVVLTIPYFSRRTDVNTDGESIFELDSIFGSGAIDLKLYENKYFLNNIDPSSEFNLPLTYFSDLSTSYSMVDAELLRGVDILLESDTPPLTNVITDFRPSNEEIELWDEDDEVTSRLAPALRVKLEKSYWQQKIIDKQGDIELSNASNFNNYFRGLYIEASAVDDNGNMALLDFGTTASNITLYYTTNPLVEGEERVQSTYILNFSGTKVNFINNEFDFTTVEGNDDTGDGRLYLKGGQGSMAVVNLFNGANFEDGFSPEFDDFKNRFVQTDGEGKFVKSKLLVNEANLVFYVDQNQVNGNEPDRLYLYDLKNGTYVTDYENDFPNNASPNDSRINHLGKLQRENDDPNGRGIKYKIKITEYINDLLLRDSTNVKLGLSVSGNVNLENVNRIFGSPQYKINNSNNDALVQRVPVSSIVSPKGTILYGNNTTEEQKKLYLEIFYTEPNN